MPQTSPEQDDDYEKVNNLYKNYKLNYEMIVKEQFALRQQHYDLQDDYATQQKLIARMTPTQPMIPVCSLMGGIFLVLSIMLQMMIMLSGGDLSSGPSESTYFLQVSTNGIPNARNPARWTYLSMCSVSEDGRNKDCGRQMPALPFNPVHRTNFGTIIGVPAGLLHEPRLHHLSKFGWAMYLLALITTFGGVVFILASNVVVRAWRKTNKDRAIKAWLAVILCVTALVLQLLAACVMTSWTVIACDGFRAAGLQAWVGTRAYCFTWGTVIFLIFATVAYILDLAAVRKRYPVQRERRARQPANAPANQPVYAPASNPGG